MIEFYCKKCGKTVKPHEYGCTFWRKNMGLKDEDPYSSLCKECWCDKIDFKDIKTFRPLCEDLDIPYIEYEIKGVLNRRFDLQKRVIIGRYVAKMRLINFYSFHYEDSDNFNEVWK